MSLAEEILKYLEPQTGAVSLWPYPKNNTTDNGPLLTARTIALLYLRGELTEAHREWFIGVADSCLLKSGLYSRHPINLDQNAWDNYIGLALGFWIFGMYDRVHEMIHYGNWHFWIWNNTSKWDRRAFFGRYQDFMPFLRACTHTGKIGWFDSVRIAAGYEWDIDSPVDETSGKMLLLDRQLVFMGRNERVDKAILAWRQNIEQRYQGGIQAVRTIYFKYNHPLGQGSLGRLDV